MKISRPLVSLDVESTGTWIEKDKIIEIALVKYFPDGTKETFCKRINPGMAIPQVVMELTGISNADVKDAPYFREVSRAVFDFIGDSDLAGFNLERFDLPLLERELSEAGLKFVWKDRRIYDAQKVYHLNEKRDLSAAYRFYCDKDLVGAHSALADSEAVYEILAKQVEKYGEGQEDISALDQFEYPAHSDFYDKERKFCWWNGKLYLMFGKYARKMSLEELIKADSGYLNWILKAEFSEGVKTIIRNALRGEIPVKSKPQAVK